MSTFTVAATTATFRSTISGSRQEAGDLQRLTLGVYLADETQWLTLLSLVTVKYAVHSPLGANVIVDVVRGPGAGALVIDGLGSTTAILVGLERSTYLPFARATGTGTFLLTGTPI